MNKRPNFIIIYADDLGFGDLGCYGANGIPTPHLDRMAQEGVRFSQGYATAATCTPSRYSLLTGAYPWRNPKAQILSGEAPMIISPEQRTLPNTLREGGYRTAVIGKWHLGLGDGNLDWNGDIRPCPLDVGFDESFIMAATNDRVPCVYLEGSRIRGLQPDDPLDVVYGGENPFPEVSTGQANPEELTLKHSDHQHWDSIVNGIGRIGFCRGGQAAQWDDETMAEEFLLKVKDFITRNKTASSPFFLYYALHQPHVPRVPSPRFAGSTGRGPRGDVIAELDWCVGEVLAHLQAEGLDEETIVVFSSDNGPVLNDGYRDEAVEKCGEHQPTGPLRGGKYSLFDGGTRVPTIVRAPGRAQAGESNALLSQADLLQSFAHLAGVEIPASESADSLEMSQALLGLDPKGRDHLVTEGIEANTVMREGDWVFIPPYEGPAVFANKSIESGNSSEPQLYNLADDIGQRRNRAAEYPEKVQELQALLERIQRSS